MTRAHLSIAALTAMASLTLAAVSLTAQQKPKNVRDGAFTADQAQRGKSGFDGVCQRCHGAALQGSEGNGPTLKGAAFLGGEVALLTTCAVALGKLESMKVSGTIFNRTCVNVGALPWNENVAVTFPECAVCVVASALLDSPSSPAIATHVTTNPRRIISAPQDSGCCASRPCSTCARRRR